MRVLVPTSAIGTVVDSFDMSDFHPQAKEEAAFRDYENSPRAEIMRRTYEEMHVNQTVEFVEKKKKEWLQFTHAEMDIMEALQELNRLIDDSDPDVDVPNIVHAYQTAERLREHHPEKEWLHLVGLIHDLGKVMALWGEPQWAVVGDTFPVGCAFDESIVFSEQFEQNPDFTNEKYNTKCGIYKENCGLDNVTMSWGHDEYLYQVLIHNNCTIPKEGLAMIRYHSFYPWHTSGAYSHLTNEEDSIALPYVLELNKFDLYSKTDNMPEIAELESYYRGLIEKYCPGVLRW